MIVPWKDRVARSVTGLTVSALLLYMYSVLERSTGRCDSVDSLMERSVTGHCDSSWAATVPWNDRVTGSSVPWTATVPWNVRVGCYCPMERSSPQAAVLVRAQAAVIVCGLEGVQDVSQCNVSDSSQRITH